MLSLTEIKSGKKIILNGEPFIVVEYLHSKIGRGGAVLRTKLQNLVTGNSLEHTFQGADKIEEAEVTKSHAQYLYAQNDNFLFMDMESYEQFELPKSVVGDGHFYLQEGMEVTLLNWNERAINIELPVKVALEVTDAPPGIKGDTAGGGDKVVTTETGLTVTVPLFIKTGDKILVNTETGNYVSRV